MLSENLYKIVALVNLLHRGNTFININLFWAFLYNLTIMPIVAGLFYGYGVTISPVWSSIAMSCSSILVVAFSHILSFFKYDEDPSHRVHNNPPSQLNTSDVDSPLKKKIMDKQYAVLNEESIRIWSIHKTIISISALVFFFYLFDWCDPFFKKQMIFPVRV